MITLIGRAAIRVIIAQWRQRSRRPCEAVWRLDVTLCVPQTCPCNSHLVGGWLADAVGLRSLDR
jgi:hypothetical protein